MEINISDRIKRSVSEALEKMGVTMAAQDVPLEFPADLSHGDFATSVALRFSKQLEMTPRAVAERIVAEMGSVTRVSKIEIAGPGFINFTLDSAMICTMVREAATESWGKGDALSGKTILMEYTDPNPFKEFHIGHLMPNAIGESIARILQNAGATVKRANYQGDVGVHVAKSIYMQLKNGVTDPTMEDLAKSYPEGSKLYEDDPEAKKEIDALNKVIYEKTDEKVNNLYAKGRALSLEHFEELYKILGTKFDYYFFESVTGPLGIEIVKKHPEVFENSDGAVVFKGEQYGLHTRVFINSKGLPTYEAKELGLAKLKTETLSFDMTITVTANEIADYFKVLTKAIELSLPELSNKVSQKFHGMMKFSDGKMSSRTGNVITGESLLMDLIESAKERAKESRADNPEKLAEQVAVAAIKFQILRQSTQKDIIFDRERALSIEGDSGPYVQYAYARCAQILSKAKDAGITAKYDECESVQDLARFLLRFPEESARSAREFEPHYVIQYMTAVAAMFNAWYAQEHILDGTPKEAHKLAIVEAVKNTLGKSLCMMGAVAPEKM